MRDCCGLLTLKHEPVPLKGIAVQLKVQDFVADVCSTLSYENSESSPVEAVFMFPMEEDSSVRDTYDDALSSGQQAFLLEESDESRDVFRLSVGSLPAGQKATVCLSYVMELAVEADGALRYCLPAVLNPRYTPAVLWSSSRWRCGVRSLWLRYVQPTAIVEGGLASATPGSLMGDPLVMVSLYPEFPAAASTPQSSCGEFIFLVDRSGSMGCPMSNEKAEPKRIQSAQDTLLLLLKSLPLGCFFNIYGFGSHFEAFFPESVKYTQQTMDSALGKVKGMGADFGGTEILEPLKDIYSKACRPGHPRQLFVFTDGEVGNTKDVINEVKKHAGTHRCFTFGIGEGASTALIKGMARAGSGHPEFITGKDRMQPKVVQSLRFALQPAVNNIVLNWDVPAGLEVVPVSETPKFLFRGHRSILYAQLKGKFDESAVGRASLQYSLGDEPHKTEISFKLQPDKHTGLTTHRLAARTLICSLEEGGSVEGEGEDKEKVKERVVKISTEARVISTHTAFIAVNKDLNQAVQGPLIQRNMRPQMMHYSSMKRMRMSSGGFGAFAGSQPRLMQHCMVGAGCRVSLLQLPNTAANQCGETGPDKEDPMLTLISLQKADGSWELNESLVSVFEKKEQEAISKMPAEVSDKAVWATVLALLWLHSFRAELKEEWEFLAMKALSWVKAQAGASLKPCLEAGNSLLGCKVEPQTLALLLNCALPLPPKRKGAPLVKGRLEAAKAKHTHLLKRQTYQDKMRDCCGLLTLKHEPVPLKGIAVQLKVQGFVADVCSTLSYENSESSPVEAVFVFPMEEDSSVYDFHAEIGGVKIQAEIREKQEARDTYDDALSSGQQAFLLEESDESRDVFRLSVGSLPAGQKATVCLSYVTELAVEADGALRYCLPAILNPRYTPAGAQSLTAPVSRASGGPVPYSLSFSAHLASPSGVAQVKSNCDLTPLEYLRDDKTQAQVSLSPGHKFDRDVELLVYYSHPHQPTAIVEGGLASTPPGSLMGDPLVMVSLYPEFPAAASTPQSSCGEFIFLVDRSGSMDCPMSNMESGPMRIESARDTLLLLLKSLPLGCFFNIYGFGSHFEAFFPESVEYTQQTMDSALGKVKGMGADFGGTEILEPLKDIYSKACRPGHPRQLFVFTDGEVGNTKDVINEVKKHAGTHRCFTFGIGEGASTALIKGMARAGSGHPEFITGKDRMQPKVMQSLRFALQPAVNNIVLNWDVPAGLEVVPVSETPKVLFRGHRSILYAQLKGKFDESAVGRRSLQYSLGDEPHKTEISFKLQPDKHTGLTTHRLAARTLICSLEEGGSVEGEGGDKEKVKERVVKISTEARVISTHTAFIAVNKDLNQAVQGPLIQRNMRPQSECYSFIYPEVSQSIGTCLPHFLVLFLFFIDKEDPMLTLISLQKADGSWELNESLVSVFEKKEQEAISKMPAEVSDKAVWATVLALLWLHSFRAELKEEWEFLAMKALSWVKAQAGASLKPCLEAGNSLLGCKVEPQTLAL
ncbi:von Willebrand factor A domain-containing protein 5A-like [Acipenser oxyrinchus oxyrinchus]|uniref:von Willebrand factor A domain-containing protein 5A-like n=1 Tax=Acipenser oxyrinchus oxyrinchus TaxID=40147 RepID=A0AAD8CLD5_ACIOX|nr:von Willebrand factor A domain-containing protein 5A-like [Acipenser oxyrinchus oxyrinchus]